MKKLSKRVRPSILNASKIFCCGFVSILYAGLDFNIPIASLTNHNTSASPFYNQENFPANFGPATHVAPEKSSNIDARFVDISLNPVTPAHVSKIDVHTLIPSRPDLRWFAHLTTWFLPGGSHPDVGVNNDTDEWVSDMLRDVKRRGFNGVIIDWWGENNPINRPTLRIQKHLALPEFNSLTYIIMIDRAKDAADLGNQIAYCEKTFFPDLQYEREEGKPILMFFGVESTLGSKGMAEIRKAMPTPSIWIPQERFWQNKEQLKEDWCDQVFQWTDNFKEGVDPGDPYYLKRVERFYKIAAEFPDKKLFGAVCPSFNGTLTRRKSWSLGKHLPVDDGLCLIERCERINEVIPPNVTRIQWATWQDYEEGSALELGIENNVKVISEIKGTSLTWKLEGSMGGDRTLNHLEIYASLDRINGALLKQVPASDRSLDLSQFSELEKGKTYHFYVNAVGKASIRDHLSAPVRHIIKGK